MAIPTRVIKRRIKSIRSTRKIMKAMELVAASKMRKATQVALGTRPYAQAIQELTHEIRRLLVDPAHPLLIGRPFTVGSPLKTLLVVLASDRGLCGGFNSQLIKKALEFLQRRRQDMVSIVTVGRRAERVARRANLPLLASFPSIANAPSFDRARPLGTFLVEQFTSEAYDRIFLAYTDFKSALVQIPLTVQLLPIIPEAELKPIRQESEAIEGGERDEEGEPSVFLFEPSPDQVCKELLPRMLELTLYQALLESAASEQSARMMAMRNAGEAAGEMLGDLTLTLNQARQATITREISEISAGKAAIE